VTLYEATTSTSEAPPRHRAIRGHLTHFKAAGAADVTIQTSEFDALGRRIKKVVTNAGDYNKTEVYFYDGQRIIQINNGSGNMVQQFIHGTQYIDELVMLRVKDKGDLYVHQDANWNVIGTTDLGRHVVERNIYTPYGELMVHQDTGFGDRDGDQDVDSTDKGTPGTTCTGTVSGSCRILDLDFDGDYDSTDATKFDALTQGAMRHPGRPSTSVSQPFAHQGLPFEPELAQYQNRARQYDPGKRRFFQHDKPDDLRHRFRPLPRRGGVHNLYSYVSGRPLILLDPTGMILMAQCCTYPPMDILGPPIGWICCGYGFTGQAESMRTSPFPCADKTLPPCMQLCTLVKESEHAGQCLARDCCQDVCGPDPPSKTEDFNGDNCSAFAAKLICYEDNCYVPNTNTECDRCEIECKQRRFCSSPVGGGLFDEIQITAACMMECSEVHGISCP